MGLRGPVGTSRLLITLVAPGLLTTCVCRASLCGGKALWGPCRGPRRGSKAGPVSPPQSVLQQPAQQALLLGGPRGPPILSHQSNSDLRGPGPRSQSQELPEMDSFSSEEPRDAETSTSASASDVGFLPLAVGPSTPIEEEAPPSLGLGLEMAHLAGGSFVEQPGWRDLGAEVPNLPQGPPFHSHSVPGRQRDGDEGGAEDRVDGPLQEVLDLLRSVDTAPPQLRELQYQVLSFRDRLKVGLPPQGQQPWCLMTGSRLCLGRHPGLIPM